MNGTAYGYVAECGGDDEESDIFHTVFLPFDMIVFRFFDFVFIVYELQYRHVILSYARSMGLHAAILP